MMAPMMEKEKMRTIFWAGDSTVQYNSILTYPQTGLGQVFHLFCKNDVKISNHGKNGRSTKSFLDEGRFQPILEEMGEGDFLFIQFGHNDEKIHDPSRYTEAFGSFQDNLRFFIQKAREKKAIPVLISPLERRCFDENGVLGPGEHGDYVEGMKQVAAEQQVAFIDLCSMSRELLIQAGSQETTHWYMNLQPGKYEVCPEGKIDNTHLKYAGAVKFAGLIAKGLKTLGGEYEALLLTEEDLAKDDIFDVHP